MRFLLSGFVLAGLAAFAAGEPPPPSDARIAGTLDQMADGDMEAREKAFRTLLNWGACEPGRIQGLLPAAATVEDDLEMRLRCDDLRRRIPREALCRRARLAVGNDDAAVRAIDLLAGDALRQADISRIAESCIPDIRRAVAALRLFLLEDPRPAVRRMAGTALGNLKDPVAAPDLVAAISDRANEVREAIPQALAEIVIAHPGPWVDEAVVPALGRILRVDPIEEIRSAAAFALGRCNSRTAVSFLVGALAVEEPEVIPSLVAAIAANGSIADAEAIDALVSRLDPADPVFLTQLIPALGQMKISAVTSRLVPFLDHADEGVRGVTVHALRKISGAPWKAMSGTGKMVIEAKAWWEQNREDPRYRYTPPSGK